MTTPADTATERFFNRLAEWQDRPAMHWRSKEVSYAQLLDRVEEWEQRFPSLGIERGTVCAYTADYWPEVVAFLLAMIRTGAVGVPFSTGAVTESERLMDLAGASVSLTFTPDGDWTVKQRTVDGPHPLVRTFLSEGHAGCIVFTSGSTGEPKGILHDFDRLLEKFEKPRTAQRTLLFLLIDHLGGINTLLGVLANGGVGCVAERRTVDEVCRVIEAARIELLPVTPAFLAMLTASADLDRYDVSSVRAITYGTDSMPQQTLQATGKRFPQAKLQQTYGLSEVGVLRSKSKNSDSLLMRVGGDGFETKIVDGVLWIRSRSAMVGYLNAPSPFDADGWLNTGDLVEIQGEYMRILGRESDIINVGGQKVFPVEVENVILQAPDVSDVTVFGEPHPLLGKIVAARVTTTSDEDPQALRTRIRKFCLERLAPFKVPARVIPATDSGHSDRFKRVRRSDES